MKKQKLPRQHIITVIAFFIIFGLGAYLRLDRLTTIPPSLSHDETAITYNAYSILKTGKDEYGTSLPLLFRSFDDYKLPGMVYATIPWVAIFGLTEHSARIPSAIFGILAIIVMYGIAIELIRDKRWALVPTFMLAVSPWHINFSRQLFESNGAVFWFMLGIYFLLRSRKNYKEILWAGLAFVMSLYFYYSVRLVIPFVGLLYLIRYWKTVIKNQKTTILTIVVCLTVFLPLGREMLSPGGMERISIVSVVNDQNYLKRKDEYVQKMGTHPSIARKLIYNRRVALIQTIIENYAKNISVRNLFVTGTGTYGALYPFEILLIPLGFLTLTTLEPFAALVICVWIFTAFLPGAFSVNQPNTLRTLIAAPAFSILSGLGIVGLFTYIAKKTSNRHVLFFTAVLLLTLFLHSFPQFKYAYFIDNPDNNALSFGDGYKQMISYVKAHENEYDHIYISGYHWRPYIFLLFWGGVDPSSYQKTGSREQFGKYTFTAASWDTNGIKLMDPSFDPNTLSGNGKTLYILSREEFEIQKKHFQKIEEISGRHAQRVFIAAVEQ